MAVSIPNAWSGTFAQPATWGNTPPALQSTVIALNNSTSVGGGSGTPTAGNWLFCIAGWNQTSLPAATVADADDIHSFWRPGNETTSTWAVSTATANTRTSVWYTPNLARVPGDVYVAPTGVMAGRACLVVEVAGLGPWDTVTGITTNYAAAATSLSLSLSAPSGQAFILGAVCGDQSGATQAFAPASWTTLPTVNANNGSDHTCDAYLTSAWIVTSGSVSVSASAVSSTDLSGVLIGVLTSAASPIPATQNPNWPYTKAEAAFGAGFQTPPDQMTWTDITSRVWSWDETTGIQYQLGEIQATNLELELDNVDGLLSPDNPAALFYTAAGANWAPVAAFYDQAVTANTPLAWWKLNDASGSSTAADSSGNSHTGTATSVTFGNTSEAVTGNTSASFASGSTSHIISSYNPALSAVTVEAWVNLNSQSQSGAPRICASSNTASDNKGFELLLAGASNNVPAIWFGNGTNFGTAGATAALPAAGWSHLAGTWDGTTITFYVNGVSAATSSMSGSMAAGTAAGIGIGYGAAFAGSYFSGLISEVAVYGSALTAAQIAAHYTAGPGVTGTPIRLRAAIGTIAGVTDNRWYVIQRNAQQWPQKITEILRRYAPATGTDVWSVLSAASTTPYRGEVYQESSLYAWWPCDDQPGAGGVQPTSLRNAAPGNTLALSITASPNGVSSQDMYSSNTAAGAFGGGVGAGGTDLTALSNSANPSVAIYTVGAQPGWMYGDPQSSLSALAAEGGQVTASPGSAAWQATGSQGNTGTHGWFLSANDTAFPALSGGVTVECWFQWAFFGSANSENNGSGTYYDVAGQPYSILSVLELATASAPVAILQADTSGHLSLITYNSGTGTTHSIYSTSDLRCGTWIHVMITLTASTWAVYLNGGITAAVSGSATIAPSAWTWLIANGDLGTSGGSTLSAIQHSGNISVSHLAVYSAVLPKWRIFAHYCAAVTAFGLLPAPTGFTVSAVENNNPTGFTPDGTEYQGQYGTGVSTFTFSAVAAAVAGSYSSGVSARSSIGGQGQGGVTPFAAAVWAGWTAVAPLVQVFTANAANSETEASAVLSAGESYTTGFGSGASGHGVGHVSAGTGASPPSSPSALGDTVAQRLERILVYGNAAIPRAIDPASLAVQAATDVGGQQPGQNLTNIADSDGGLMYVDNLGWLVYWQKSHLAAQYASPVWALGPETGSGQIPYYREIDIVGDPQRVWNAITIQPFSPDGASLPLVTPTSAAAVKASQLQYGAQPQQLASYLQSTTEMQSFANWLLACFGTLHNRVEGARTDAAAYPVAWTYVYGANVGDVVTVEDWKIGGGGLNGTYRINQIRRRIRYAGQDGQAEGVLEVQASWEPPSYWS